MRIEAAVPVGVKGFLLLLQSDAPVLRRDRLLDVDGTERFVWFPSVDYRLQKLDAEERHAESSLVAARLGPVVFYINKCHLGMGGVRVFKLSPPTHPNVRSKKNIEVIYEFRHAASRECANSGSVCIIQNSCNSTPNAIRSNFFQQAIQQCI